MLSDTLNNNLTLIEQSELQKTGVDLFRPKMFVFLSCVLYNYL